MKSLNSVSVMRPIRKRKVKPGKDTEQDATDRGFISITRRLGDLVHHVLKKHVLGKLISAQSTER